jgi:hypothetical protein
VKPSSHLVQHQGQHVMRKARTWQFAQGAYGIATVRRGSCGNSHFNHTLCLPPTRQLKCGGQQINLTPSAMFTLPTKDRAGDPSGLGLNDSIPSQNLEKGDPIALFSQLQVDQTLLRRVKRQL